MTMDRMDKELRCRGGFDTVTRTYKTKLKMYEFRVTRGEHWAIYHFTYPNGFSSKLVDETQRLFIEQVIKNFNERFKEDKNMTLTDYKMVCNDDGSISVFCAPPTINPFDIKKVIFNEPATIVFWADGTKTVVKCQEWDEFDPEKGLAMAIAKKAYGNIGHYYENMKKWVDPYYDAQAKMYEEFREAIIEAENAEEEPVWWIWVEEMTERDMGGCKKGLFKHPKSYKRKCDATRVAKKNYGDSTKYNFIVSQENPWL